MVYSGTAPLKAYRSLRQSYANHSFQLLFVLWDPGFD